MQVRRCDLAHDLVLPSLLFAALGAMSWAVRGTLGFGGGAGCVFAGVLWGAAWWYCAREPQREQTRRYASGWIILALTIGMGIAGQRGWRQWSHFFVGTLSTNWAAQESVPISPAYGYLWMFIAGVPWAGLGACLLAWCGSQRETRIWHWMARLSCGIGAGLAARWLFDLLPQFFLPLYTQLESRYQEPEANPELRRLTNDCGFAVLHMGYYLGFLFFEAVRRDWKNVVLILTVGVVNGAGWAALQNWEWAPGVWPNSDFLWWRCWESTGGISIGIAYGIAYFLVNRRMTEPERAAIRDRRDLSGPNFEWLLIFCGLTAVADAFAGKLIGPAGSVGIGNRQLPLDLDAWGPLYCALVLIFGGAYYLSYRGTTIDGVPISAGGPLPRTVPAAVCVVVALTAPLFAKPTLESVALVLLRTCVADPIATRWLTLATLMVHLLYIATVIGCGMIWYFARRSQLEAERDRSTPSNGDPNLERLGIWLGVLMGFAVSLLCGLNGWFGTYRGIRRIDALWHFFGPVFLLCLLAILWQSLKRPLPRNLRRDPFPRADGLLWLVLIVQNVIAQLATGPLTDWNQAAFNIFYALLLAITGVIVFHFGSLRSRAAVG